MKKSDKIWLGIAILVLVAFFFVAPSTIVGLSTVNFKDCPIPVAPCGVAASYYVFCSNDVTKTSGQIETELPMLQIPLTNQKYTVPDELTKYLNNSGFHAEMKSNATISDLKNAIDAKKIVIVMGNVYAPDLTAGFTIPLAHYWVVTNYDAQKIYTWNAPIVGQKGSYTYPDFETNWNALVIYNHLMIVVDRTEPPATTNVFSEFFGSFLKPTQEQTTPLQPVTTSQTMPPCVGELCEPKPPIQTGLNVPAPYSQPTAEESCANISANDRTYAWALDDLGVCNIASCHEQSKYDEWYPSYCTPEGQVNMRTVTQYLLPDCSPTFTTEETTLPQDFCKKCDAPRITSDWAFYKQLKGENVYKRTLTAEYGTDCIEKSVVQYKISTSIENIEQPENPEMPVLPILVIVLVAIFGYVAYKKFGKK